LCAQDKGENLANPQRSRRLGCAPDPITPICGVLDRLAAGVSLAVNGTLKD
jgi:hypothetical protein